MKMSLIQKDRRRMGCSRCSFSGLGWRVSFFEFGERNSGNGNEEGGHCGGKKEQSLTDSETLILPTNKNSTQQVPSHEQQQEDVMQRLVRGRVVDAQQDQPGGAGEGEDEGEGDEDPLAARGVGHEAAAVPQPAVGQQGGVERQRRQHAAGDEERLELVGAHVGDVGDGEAGPHLGVARAVGADEPVEEQAEEHGEPEEARDDGEDPPGQREGHRVVVVFFAWYCSPNRLGGGC
jgi:hypothetical protein